MGELVVRGGRRLNGTVRVNGAKNAALPIMAASIMASGPVVLDSVPRLLDVDVMIEVLSALGAHVTREGSRLTIDPRDIDQYAVPARLMQKMRASIFVVGPLLARMGRAEVLQPGGCAIGDRPIDLHLMAFRQLGATICESEDAPTLLLGDHLSGGEVHLPMVSVGATENAIMLASMIEHETRIRNAAMEPEIVDLAQFLEKLGVTVRGAGTPDMRIIGKKKLGTAEHFIIPDRIEAATFMLATAATGGQVVLENCIAEHLPGLFGRLREVGVEITLEEGDRVVVEAPESYRAFPMSIHTSPFPGFATDIQAQMMAFLLRVPGVHIISERVFDNRLTHAKELRRMGAQIVADQRVALVYGGRRLYGGAVTAPDLRAGAALAIAGLQAEGETVIENRHFIERGYQDFGQRLVSLGADVTER